MKSFSTLVFILLFNLLIFDSFSQNQVRIFGYVTDSIGNGIETVNIKQEGTDNGSTTDTDGFYELFVTPQKNISVQFEHIAFESRRIKLSDVSKERQLDVRLVYLSHMLGEIEVRELHKQTSTVELIDFESLRALPGSGDFSGLLTTIGTGVSSTNDLSNQYSVRGGSYDENIIYVNGIEIYRPLLIRAGQQEGLSFINSDMVGAVSFSAGAFDAKYGDKMSSVLDIQYKTPEKFEGSVSLSLLGASAYVGSRSKKFSQMHGIRYKTSRYLLGTLDEKGEYNPNYVDYQTYLTYNFSPKWELTFLGNFSHNSYDFIPEDRQTNFGTSTMIRQFMVYFEGQEKDIFQTSFGALTLNYKPLKNVKLSLMTSAFHTNEEETYDITGQYWLSELSSDGEKENTLGIGTYHEHARNKLKASVINISHSGEWNEPSGHQVKWGAGFQQEIIEDRLKEWEMRDSAGYSIGATGYNPNREKIELYYNLTGKADLNTYRLQAFLQDTYKYQWDVGTLTATAGVRANYWSYNNELLISPRVSVGFIPEWEHRFIFRFGAGFYYQAPFYKELRYTQRDEATGNSTMMLNEDVKAQRTIHFVLGSDYHFKGWGRPFKLTAEAYYKYAPRLTPYQVDNVRIRYLSDQVAKGYTTGLDLKLFGELLPGTDSWVSVSLMSSKEDIIDDSRIVNGETIYPGYISRPNEQRYSFSMFFQDYFPNNPKYKVHLKFIWADGLPFGPPNAPRYKATMRTPPYRRVDIGASRILASSSNDKFMSKGMFKYIKNIWLTLEVFNLLNIKNVNSYYWVTDIYNQQYAVPNYLTSTQINLKLFVDF